MQEMGLHIAQLIRDVLNDVAFSHFAAVFDVRAVRTWSSLEERALLYGVANRYTPGGVIVELGSYCGGSAAFFARGLADKPGGRVGRVVCVDPLLGAPPWLALPPEMFTLTEMRANLEFFGIEQHVDLKVGDSAAVAAVWPIEPIDVLLIDGDHSFEGALRDLECWAPKLRDGGILLIDDIDNIPELQALEEVMRSMHTLMRHDPVGGIGVYEIQKGGWKLVEELETLLTARHIYRPWSFEPVHAHMLSPSYLRTYKQTGSAFDQAYDLGYLAVAEAGDYAILLNTPVEFTQIMKFIHADRGGGDLHEIQDALRYGRIFRVVACRPEAAPQAARLLLPGGLLLAWSDISITPEETAQLSGMMRMAGLDGVGNNGGDRPLFWGVAGIASLTPSRILGAHMSVRTLS